ncbi:TetR/AcrR family transcriptional regulator [Mangrovitalea sediminis]|uniref:TetR/AcrR family transcriptional regulator n=1 Tax=Mangrovitalea sediminis TaxID=1982043 RepID=UPI000BE52067|nr:TetR/AcrR family transcriptional regulator [Mangrovitalea sediminis]
MAYRETDRVRARKAEARSRLIAAAFALVTKGGFRNAQVSQVAELAGVATGSVYRHFASKGELFSEVFRIATQKEVDKVSEALATPGSALERLERALRTFAVRALKAPTLAWSLIAEPVDPQVDADRLQYRLAYAELFQRAIEEGTATGELPPQDPRISATALVGTIAEVLVGPLSPGSHAALGASGPSHQHHLVEGIVRFCLQALTGKALNTDNSPQSFAEGASS